MDKAKSSVISMIGHSPSTEGWSRVGIVEDMVWMWKCSRKGLTTVVYLNERTAEMQATGKARGVNTNVRTCTVVKRCGLCSLAAEPGRSLCDGCAQTIQVLLNLAYLDNSNKDISFENYTDRPEYGYRDAEYDADSATAYRNWMEELK